MVDSRSVYRMIFIAKVWNSFQPKSSNTCKVHSSLVNDHRATGPCGYSWLCLQMGNAKAIQNMIRYDLISMRSMLSYEFMCTSKSPVLNPQGQILDGRRLDVSRSYSEQNLFDWCPGQSSSQQDVFDVCPSWLSTWLWFVCTRQNHHL